jgi:hypothetical protein
MPERSVAGKSIVTRRAIVDIVRTAVQSSYGVTGFADASLARRLLRWIGLDRSGIRLSKEGGLHLDGTARSQRTCCQATSSRRGDGIEEAQA